MKKHICLGQSSHGSIYCTINLEEKKKGLCLSIVGVQGPWSNGDCVGPCGQIIDSLKEITTYAEGWDKESVAFFCHIWERWHLNDMKAGSPAQEDYLRDNPVSYTSPQTHYDQACKALGEVGLHPDMSIQVQRKEKDGTVRTVGYAYGSQWLYEPLPSNVVNYLQSLHENGDDLPKAWRK